MSRLNELIEKYCPDGVEYKELNEVCRFQNGFAFKSRLFSESGLPILRITNILDGKLSNDGYVYFNQNDYKENLNNYIVKPNNIVVAMSGATTGKIGYNYFKKEYYLNQRVGMFLPDESFLLNRYLYHWLLGQSRNILAISSGTGAQPNLSSVKMMKFKLPVPPLEVQAEIVRILDSFTELEKELELRRKQYEYYRDLLLDFKDVHAGGTNAYSVPWLADMLHELCPDGVEYKALGEFANISRGKIMSKDYLKENIGEYPVYSSQTENNGQMGSISTYMYDGEYLTWTTDGANAGTVFFRSGKFSITNVCGLIDVKNSNIIPKFLYYYLYKEAPNHVKAGMGNPKLMSNVMSNIKLPVPPLEVQRRIVHILDRFDALCNDLTNGLPAEIALRRKQYEFYRDKLLSFKELKEA